MGTNYKPLLRDSAELKLITEGSEKIILVSCSLGISEPLALIPAVGPILVALDGTRSLEELRVNFEVQGVQPEIVDRVHDLLDQKFYFDNENFAQKKAQLLLDFNCSATRAPAHAGRIYPENHQELNRYVENLLNLGSEPSQIESSNKLLAIVAPHIDYHRGSAVYAKAYRALAGQSPDVCILIGTSHQAGKNVFRLCDKDFACPNGTLKTNKEFIQLLADKYGRDRAFVDEVLHRREHSLELQLPFLNYLTPQTTLVPILVGSFYHYLRGQSMQDADNNYWDFIGALAECYEIFKDRGQKVIFVAGVDMAHVGQSFGDKFILDDQICSQIREEDQDYLKCISERDPSHMFAHIKKDSDSRRICGFPTMQALLDLFQRLDISFETRFLGYAQALNSDTQCLVSFAALELLMNQ